MYSKWESEWNIGFKYINKTWFYVWLLSRIILVVLLMWFSVYHLFYWLIQCIGGNFLYLGTTIVETLNSIKNIILCISKALQTNSVQRAIKPANHEKKIKMAQGYLQANLIVYWRIGSLFFSPIFGHFASYSAYNIIGICWDKRIVFCYFVMGDIYLTKGRNVGYQGLRDDFYV